MSRFLLVAILVAGCGGAKTVDDESMSAADHRKAAAEHHEEAVSHEGEADLTGTGDSLYGLGDYNLDLYHDTEADRHHLLAAEHTAAAQRLEAFEQEQCASFPPATRSKCPLMGTVTAVKDVENGAELTIVDGVNMEAITAHVKCHHAFARTQGREGMDSCPMYVEGFAVEREGNVLRMTTDPDHIEALRTRSRAHMPHK